MATSDSVLDALPPGTRRVLLDFVESTKSALGADLQSIVLFGSGAEGRLRETSDVNVLLLLTRFQAPAVSALRTALVAASAAVRLQPMFLLKGELASAARLFAVKFTDIRQRHVVLHGDDPFVGLEIARASEILRLQQVLLNMTLRMRNAFAESGLLEERMVLLLADAVGPLRVCAQLMLDLEGQATPTPKEAMSVVARELDCPADLLTQLASARELGRLPPGISEKAVVEVLALIEAMRARAERLS